MLNSKYMDITPPVMAAIKAGTPLAVIETGFFMKLPHPGNLAALKSCEESFWRRDCVPCFVGIVDGRIKVGLTPEDAEKICAQGEAVNREGIPAMIATHGTAGVTASAAMCIASLAGVVPVVCPGLTESPSDITALRTTRRAVFCNKVSRDSTNVFVAQGIPVLVTGLADDAVADAYAVLQDMNFPECAVIPCGPTLADLAEHTAGAAIALKKRNNFT